MAFFRKSSTSLTEDAPSTLPAAPTVESIDVEAEVPADEVPVEVAIAVGALVAEVVHPCPPRAEKVQGHCSSQDNSSSQVPWHHSAFIVHLVLLFWILAQSCRNLHPLRWHPASETKNLQGFCVVVDEEIGDVGPFGEPPAP